MITPRTPLVPSARTSSRLMSPTARLHLLRAALRDITAQDPSNPANTAKYVGVTDLDDAYRVRNATIYRALGLAVALGYRAGVQINLDEPKRPMVYIDLPDAGQISWHMPEYAEDWDGHDTAAKYERIRLFTTSSTQQLTR